MFSFRPIVPVLLALALGQNAFGAPVKKPKPVKKPQIKKPKVEAPKVELLPRPQKSGGVEIQISAAGFGVPTVVSNDEQVRENRTTGFYFSYFARAQNPELTGKLDGAVNLTGLFAPDGSPLPSSASASVLNAPDDSTRVVNPIKVVGGTRFFADVLPSWKSVRAEFEVRNLIAPPQDAGIDKSAHEFKAVALPALGEKITESAPDLEFQTERGTKIKLVKIEREKREGNSKTGRARFFWRAEPLASATDYNVELQNCRIVYDVPDASDFGYSNKEYGDSTEVKIEGLNAPDAAKSATLSFDLTESARGWRKASAFSRVSFEIPVAPTWKAAPLPIQTPPVLPVAAKNADFEATWESLGDTSGSWFEMHSRLWMRDLKPDSALGAWTPKSVEFPNGQRSGSLFSWATPSEGVFHADNSIHRAGESGYSLRASDYMLETAPAKVDLEIKAQRARTLLVGHSFKNVPLPAPNTMREYGPNEFNDGIWKLRRVIWAEGEEIEKQLGNSRSWLILTFERDPKTAFEDDNMMLMESVFYDEKGVTDRGSSTFQDGDPMLKGAKKTRISLLLSPPVPGTTHFSANFRVQQQIWSGPIQTLILPAVPIGSAAKP